jgi:putative transposase
MDAFVQVNDILAVSKSNAVARLTVAFCHDGCLFWMDERMQQNITAKLKLLTTPEQHQMLRQTQVAYRDALNYVSRYAFEHGKTSSNERLQQGTYHEIRILFNLPSQMACNVPRQVAGTYKGLWTKLKQNLAHRKAGHTKKRYKGLDKSPKYVLSLDMSYRAHLSKVS